MGSPVMKELITNPELSSKPSSQTIMGLLAHRLREFYFVDLNLIIPNNNATPDKPNLNV